MRIVEITCCKNCPYLERKSQDWDFKEQLYCKKSEQFIDSRRTDNRWTLVLDRIAEFCQLKEV